MKTETKVLGIILFATLLILGGGVYFLSKLPPTSNDPTNQPVVDIDYSKGQKIGTDSAKVRLVEFADFQCPACGAAEPVVEEILRRNDPNIQYIYRHYPLPQHKNARPAANAAMAAAAEGKFWPLHDALFASQSTWSELPNPVDIFTKLASEHEIDPNKVKTAVETKQYEAILNDDIAEGNRLGVDATPTFYLNGKKMILKDYTQLKDQVDSALKTP